VPWRAPVSSRPDPTVLYDRASGQTRELTAKLDNNVGDFPWAPDSKKIYFSSDVTAPRHPSGTVPDGRDHGGQGRH
jgi:hypothetical protein